MRAIRTDTRVSDAAHRAEAFGEWRDPVEYTLSRLRVLDPNAIIAGGACRDAVLRNPIADIDAYFYVPHNSNAGQTIERLTLAGFTNVREMRPDGSSNGQYAGMAQLRWVFETEVSGYPVQLIAMAVPTFSDCVEAFGVNISKCWYDGSYIRVSREAHEDMVNSKLTVPEGITTSQRYVDKLVRKLQPARGVDIRGEVIGSDRSPGHVPEESRLPEQGTLPQRNLYFSNGGAPTPSRGHTVTVDINPWRVTDFDEYVLATSTPPIRTERVTEDDEMFERLTQGS